MLHKSLMKGLSALIAISFSLGLSGCSLLPGGLTGPRPQEADGSGPLSAQDVPCLLRCGNSLG